MKRTLILVLALILALVLSSTGSGGGTEIAHGRPATASLSLSSPDSAFDGDTATAWNAGNGAPQWIEVDLGADYRITEVDGCADINPDGEVAHVVEGRTSSGATYFLGSYSGPSIRNGWLKIPCDPAAPVRYLRVTTTSSPSWIAWFEVKVYSDLPVPVRRTLWGALKRRFR